MAGGCHSPGMTAVPARFRAGTCVSRGTGLDAFGRARRPRGRCRPARARRRHAPGSPPAVARRVVEDVLAFHAEPVADVRAPSARPPPDLRRAEPGDLRPDQRGAGPPRRGRPRAQRAPAAAPRLRIDPEGAREMCGIVGYVGAQQAAPILLEGLTRLEHRGYDSAGIAVLGGSGTAGRQAGRPGPGPRRVAAQAVRGQGRDRPHPLGDARPGHRRERPPPHRRRRPGGGRPQRDPRQRLRAAGRPRRRRCRAGVRHRHRGARPPGRALRRRHPRGQGPRRAGRGRGDLRPGRRARRLPRPDGGGPARQPADRRRRRARDVRRLRPRRRWCATRPPSPTSRTASWRR